MAHVADVFPERRCNGRKRAMLSAGAKLAAFGERFLSAIATRSRELGLPLDAGRRARSSLASGSP